MNKYSIQSGIWPDRCLRWFEHKIASGDVTPAGLDPAIKTVDTLYANDWQAQISNPTGYGVTVSTKNIKYAGKLIEKTTDTSGNAFATQEIKDVVNPIISGGQPFTFEGWLSVSSCSTTAAGIALRIGMQITVMAATRELRVSTRGEGQGSYTLTTTGVTAVANQAYYISFSYENLTLRVYIDGNKVVERTNFTPWTLDTSLFSTGAGPICTFESFRFSNTAKYVDATHVVPTSVLPIDSSVVAIMDFASNFESGESVNEITLPSNSICHGAKVKPTTTLTTSAGSLEVSLSAVEPILSAYEVKDVTPAPEEFKTSVCLVPVTDNLVKVNFSANPTAGEISIWLLLSRDI